MAVWNWLQQNTAAVTGASDLMFAAIWVIYLQLFYRQYRRQKRVELLIHHAQGMGPSASCLLVNMSSEPVHIQCVMARVETLHETRTHQVTDYRRISVDDAHPKQLLRQGPLRSGDFLLLGRFMDILLARRRPDGKAAESNELPQELEDVLALEIRTVAIHGPSDHAVGARRRFEVEYQDGHLQIRPEQLDTEQLASRHHRPLVRAWLRDCFAPSLPEDGARIKRPSVESPK